MKLRILYILPIFEALNVFSQTDRPNFIVIMADDAGYNDFGFQGSKEFITPNIDKVAADGVKFTCAYVSASVSSPSRAGFLTGKYQERFGHENNLPETPLYGAVPENSGLPLGEKTIADYLSSVGYKTGLIGKWHLGEHPNFHPNKRGFDYFFGFLGGSRSYWDTEEIDSRKLYRNTKLIHQKGYLTDALADDAVRYIHNNQKKPFFLYLSFNAVHLPMEAKAEDVKLFETIKYPQRRTLAAMTYAMDKGIGRVIRALDSCGISENTMVVFLSDNGGPTAQNGSNNYPLSGTKGSKKEGGIRIPFLIKWPKCIEKGEEYTKPIISLDILPTILSAAKCNYVLPRTDGVDLIPYIKKSIVSSPHDTLYWRRGSFAAIRLGDWKLIRYPDRLPELYDLSNDISESYNIAVKNQDKVKNMLKLLFEWETKMYPPRWQENTMWLKKNLNCFDDYPAKNIN